MSASSTATATILFLQMGDRPVGALFERALQGKNVSLEVVQCVNADERHPVLRRDADWARFDGVIISGSSYLVTDKLPWSVLVGNKMKEYISRTHGDRTRIPILGVCYGHQLLGDVLPSGMVDFMPARQVGGRSCVLHVEECNRDELFSVFTRELNRADLRVNVLHRQRVFRAPTGATVLGRSDHDENFAIRFDHHVWGVQFHPEFPKDVVRNAVEFHYKNLEPQPTSQSVLSQALQDVNTNEDGIILLHRFAQLVHENRANRNRAGSTTSKPSSMKLHPLPSSKL